VKRFLSAVAGAAVATDPNPNRNIYS